MISLIRPSMTDCPYHLEIASAKRDSIKLLLEMLGLQHPQLLGTVSCQNARHWDPVAVVYQSSLEWLDSIIKIDYLNCPDRSPCGQEIFSDK